jgi:hypothetical protein
MEILQSYLPYKSATTDVMHRRLATPNWTDIVVVVGLSLLLLYLLKVLLQQSEVWRL